MTVKNVTIALPDDVYRDARIEAAHRDTSVSALVRDYLVSLSDSSARRAANSARRRALVASIRERHRAAGTVASASKRLTREELYNERLDRR
ncbi:MAG: hypothetical protein J2O46_07145 [Nocardioides sp.]|nr:hypothetical protein [Nocardioides sp.]